MSDTPTVLNVSVNGTPQPQGSARVFMHGGVPKITTDNAKLKPWRKQVASAAMLAMESSDWVTSDAPIAVYLVFRLPKGKSVRRLLPTVRPDLDKLTRAALDSLTVAGVYNDDAQVVRLNIAKFYAGGTPPGVTITVYEVRDQ